LGTINPLLRGGHLFLPWLTHIIFCTTEHSPPDQAFDQPRKMPSTAEGNPIALFFKHLESDCVENALAYLWKNKGGEIRQRRYLWAHCSALPCRLSTDGPPHEPNGFSWEGGCIHGCHTLISPDGSTLRAPSVSASPLEQACTLD
jgi:hypothetical protein